MDFCNTHQLKNIGWSRCALSFRQWHQTQRCHIAVQHTSCFVEVLRTLFVVLGEKRFLFRSWIWGICS